MKLSDLKNISDDEVLAELGIPKLTPSRMKCALMAVKTLREKI